MDADHCKSLPLLERTYALLDERTESLEVVARAAGVNEWWLRKFAQRTGRDYGVNRVQRLHDYLESQAPEAKAVAS